MGCRQIPYQRNQEQGRPEVLPNVGGHDSLTTKQLGNECEASGPMKWDLGR